MACAAKRLLLSIEEQSDFDQVRDAFFEAYKPKTDHELVLFEDTVRAHWFWTRAQAAHTAFLEAVVESERKADPKLSADQALARVFTDDKHAKRFRLLMRYESAAERTYRKNLAELERALLARATADEHRRRIAAARRMRESGNRNWLRFAIPGDDPRADGSGPFPSRERAVPTTPFQPVR